MISLADFEGVWTMSRRIDDRRAGVTGRLAGVSEWVWRGGVLWQEERGVLHYGTAPPMQAVRRYQWRPGDRPAQFEVLFDDGRPFHTVASAARHPEAHHFCDPDDYTVSYDFSRWPVWSSEWTVTGPRKDALIRTEFRPQV